MTASSKARMVLRAMTEREINARIAQLTTAIDIIAPSLQKMRWERRGLLISLANRRRMAADPGAFQRVRDSRRSAVAQ